MTLNYTIFSNFRQRLNINLFYFFAIPIKVIHNLIMMKRFFILWVSIVFLLGISPSVSALEIVYPQKNPYYTNAKETFIVGNVDKKSKLFVNNNPLKVWKNGMFCFVPTLSDGQNKFVFVEKKKNKSFSKEILVMKNLPKQYKSSANTKKIQQVNYEKIVSAFIVKNNVPIRNQPSDNAKRITHLPMNTNLFIQSEYGNWYKLFSYDSKEPMWINKSHVSILSFIDEIPLADISDIDFYQDDKFCFLKFFIDFQNPYKIVENENSLDLTFYNVNSIEDLKPALKKQNVFDEIYIKSFENNNLTLTIKQNSKLWGYDAEYYGNSFVLKLRKTPIIDKKHPLKGLTIAVDAGHGGEEKGALGCAGIDEKTINLQISLKLKKILEKQGAEVIMTREKDEYVEIYRRPEIAKINNAIICLSIHANSMLDGNPYKKHGTSVFYYNEQAKGLATIINNRMVNDLRLRDDGTNYASLVLTRPTLPISVLIETAYMPNPYEYSKLTNSKFQNRIAKSIAKGLGEYLLEDMKNIKKKSL